MSDNDNGFYSPFKKDGSSMQPSPGVTAPSSTVVGDDHDTCSSSPTSMYSTSIYSTNSHLRQDSFESSVVHTKHNNSNGTTVNDSNNLTSIITSNLSKERKLYHSSSLRSNNNIHSVELSPTDANPVSLQAHSTSILSSNSLVTTSNSNVTLAVEPPNTPSISFSYTNGKNDGSEKTCNVEVVSPQSDFYIRGGKSGFWRDLWRMSIIKDGKPTAKFWLILIGLSTLTLLIVIPVMVVTLSQSSQTTKNNNGTTSINNNGTIFNDD